MGTHTHTIPADLTDPRADYVFLDEIERTRDGRSGVPMTKKKKTVNE